MLLWICLTVVVMFTFTSLTHTAKNANDIHDTIFYAIFCLLLGIGYTVFCFKFNHELEYLIGTLIAMPLAQRYSTRDE
jgi:hypothetical protein